MALTTMKARSGPAVVEYDSVLEAVRPEVVIRAPAGAAGIPVSVVAGGDSDIGNDSDAAATTDTGTFSLISLFKRLLQKWTAGLALIAGEAHVGQFGGQLNSVAAPELTRPADTTAYAAKDVVSPAALVVSGASNATPIVLTTGAHGLATGDRVTVASVGGNTAANGSWLVTVISPTTFSLDGSVGNGAYTSGGVVQTLLKFTDVLRINGGQGYIIKARLLTDQKTCTARFRLHLYHTQPDPIADNSPMLNLYADEAKWAGNIDFPALGTEDPTSSTGASIVVTPNTSGGNLPLSVISTGSSKTLYGVLEPLDAFTPASGQKFRVRLTADLY